MTQARIKIGKVEANQAIGKSAIKVTFKIELEVGPAMLQTWFIRFDGNEHGAYYTEVGKLEKD